MTSASRLPDKGKARRKVLLVDDHAVVRQGLAELINQQNDMTVCGMAGDVAAALTAVKSLAPDVALVDIMLGGRDGIELVKELHDSGYTTPILILSMHDETLYAERALRAGAKGYVMKQEPAAVLMKAIRQVVEGRIYVSERIAAKVLNQFASSASFDSLSPVERLTDRELEVFRLIGQGIGVHEIAEKLFISFRTVESHREHIKQKLNLTSTSELLRYAVHHLFGDDSPK
jgi:DNA-binding NarL/FixJ family response regulator